MALWVNHVAIRTARNGTNSHTVDPASTGTVVDGAAFTPTAGRLLVCYVEGAVTSTTPAGWTLPTNGSAIANTGLYVWWIVAAGGDSWSTTHNGTNYPVMFDIYEFMEGSAFVDPAAAAVGVANGGAGPTLSGLTGPNLLSAVMAQNSGTGGDTTIAWSDGTEQFEDWVVSDGVAPGYSYSLTYLDNSVLSSWSSAATITSGTGDTLERLVTAVTVEPAPDEGQPVLWRARVYVS